MLGRKLVLIFVGLAKKISRLDNQSKFQMLHYFLAVMLVERRASPIWRLHTGRCKFAHNISPNIRSLEKCRDLNLEKCRLYDFFTLSTESFWIYYFFIV